MVHVAFLHKRYIDLIETGAKTVESRLSINRPLCWNIKDGDIVLFKEVGGEIRLSAQVKAVHKFDNLTPRDIQVLAELFSDTVGVKESDPYWTTKSRSKFAVFVEIENMVIIDFPKHLTPRGVQSAWVSNFAVNQPLG